MALVADRAERAGLAQGIGFGVTNTAWAVGALLGPAIGGALAQAFGDPVPYLLCGALCALTLVAALRGNARVRVAGVRRPRGTGRAPTRRRGAGDGSRAR